MPTEEGEHSVDWWLGNLNGRMTNVEERARNIDGKLNAIIGGGVFQLVTWLGFVVWFVIATGHRP